MTATPTARERELERHLVKDRTVIREFYQELIRLGVLGGSAGMYSWTKADARRFARDIVAAVKAMPAP